MINGREQSEKISENGRFNLNGKKMKKGKTKRGLKKSKLVRRKRYREEEIKEKEEMEDIERGYFI